MTSNNPDPYEPMPAAPPVRPDQSGSPAVARPTTVTIAFWLWIAVSAVLVLSVVSALALDRATIEDALRQADSSLTPAELDAAASLFTTFAVAIPLVFLAAFLGGAFPMRAGRNWARILLTVFGGLLIVLTLLGTAGANPIITVVLVALIGAAIVLMFIGQSAPYFAPRKPAY